MALKFNELQNKILNARTVRERDVILRQLYVDNAQNKAGDELLTHHLEILITVLSHLATISFGVSSLKTIRNNNYTSSLTICSEMIRRLLDRGEAPHSSEVASLWPSVGRLIGTLAEYEGDHEVLRSGIWLAYRASKITIAVWRDSLNLPSASVFYSPEEVDFASKLLLPISAAMPVSEQVAALVADIEYLQRRLARGLKGT